LRVFVPVEDDLATINSIRSRHATEVVAEEEDYSFLDDGIDVSMDETPMITG
jgi:hypothetical protein